MTSLEVGWALHPVARPLCEKTHRTDGVTGPRAGTPTDPELEGACDRLCSEHKGTALRGAPPGQVCRDCTPGNRGGLHPPSLSIPSPRRKGNKGLIEHAGAQRGERGAGQGTEYGVLHSPPTPTRPPLPKQAGSGQAASSASQRPEASALPVATPGSSSRRGPTTQVPSGRA